MVLICVAVLVDEDLRSHAARMRVVERRRKASLLKWFFMVSPAAIIARLSGKDSCGSLLQVLIGQVGALG